MTGWEGGRMCGDAWGGGARWDWGWQTDWLKTALRGRLGERGGRGSAQMWRKGLRWWRIERADQRCDVWVRNWQGKRGGADWVVLIILKSWLGTEACHHSLPCFRATPLL